MLKPSGSAVKNPPAVQETPQEPRVQSLGWEDPLEKKMATHSSTFTYTVYCTIMGRGAWWATVHGGHKQWDMT